MSRQRENQCPEFNRELLQNQRDEILMATMPYDEEALNQDGLCKLLLKSAENQQKILESIGRLAQVMSSTGDFIAGASEATSAVTNAELQRSQLEAIHSFVKALKAKDLTPRSFLKC